MNATRVLIVGFGLVAMACGGGSKAKSGDDMSSMDKRMKKSMDKGGPEAWAPLEAGADYKTWKKVSKQPFYSKPHGKRFVEIYVNDIAYEAYTTEKVLPVGSVLVKPSWEGKDGKPTTNAGPLFVMVKKEKGFSKEHNDWWYAIRWENPPAPFNKNGNIYWRSPSKKVDYCWSCHENYDNEVGLPPRAMRTWKEKGDDDDDDDKKE